MWYWDVDRKESNMSRTKYRITPTDDGKWKVKRDGAKRADSIYEDKVDAVARGRELGHGNKTAQLVVHGRDGKIQTEHTYERDPLPPRG